MKFNKIKKYLYVIIGIFLFFSNISGLTARTYEETKNDTSWIKNGTGKIICGYTNSTSGTKNYIMLGINVGESVLQVGAYPSLGVVQAISDSATANALPTKINGKVSIYYEPTGAQKLLETGQCPAEAYSDLYNKLICFGSLDYCNKANGSARFSGSSVIEETMDVAKLKSDIEYKIARLSCDEIFNTDDSTYVFDLIGLENANNFPEFIKTIYDSATEKFNSKLENCKNQKLATLEDEEKKCEEYLRSGNKTQYDQCMKLVNEKRGEIEDKADSIAQKLKETIMDIGDLTVVKSCEELVGKNLKLFFKIVYTFFKIAAPVLTVILGMFDFTKVASSSDPDKDMKAAFQKIIKRLVIIVVIFIIPTVLVIIQKIWPVLDLTCILD